jgi:Uma2 family endonuclease
LEAQRLKIGPDEALPCGDVLYELADGFLVEKETTAYTSFVASRLACDLSEYLEPRRTGQIIQYAAFLLNESGSNRRRPDVAFISAASWPLDVMPSLTGDWDVVPELAVECTIRGESIARILQKLRDYFSAGVREVWVIIPEGQSVQTYRSLNDVRTYCVADQLRSEIFPDWTLSISELLPHQLHPERDSFLPPSAVMEGL